MKIEGRFLLFDTPHNFRSGIGEHIFPKDCDLTIPKKIAIIYEFQTCLKECVLGSGEVIRDDKGLYLKAEIKNFPEDVNGLGGFYNKLKFDTSDGINVINKANLAYVSVTNTPVSEEYRFWVVKEEDNK